MRAGERGILLTIAEAVAIYRVPAGTLRRWASEDDWTPFGSGYRRYWSYDQVQDSYDERRNPLTCTA